MQENLLTEGQLKPIRISKLNLLSDQDLPEDSIYG